MVRIARRIAIGLVGLLALLMLVLTVWVQATPEGRAAYNVAEYRVRRLLPPPRLGPTGEISGRIVSASGVPLPGAFSLVATSRGQVFQGVSGEDGRYRITGVPAGSYMPVAAAWGYQEERMEGGAAIPVAGGEMTANVNFVLMPYEPYKPVVDLIRFGPPQSVSGDFPRALQAIRSPVVYRHDGAELANAYLYEPAGSDPLPTLLLVLPTPALGWEPISIALANEGFVVLAVGPAEVRGIDIEAHVKDLVAVTRLLLEGRLSERADPMRVAALAGSFSSVLLFRALRDLPPLEGVVTMGGVSDGFLGYQALFREDLQLPPPFDSFVASLGRPDRYPEIYLAYSPAFFAEHLPPTLIIHTEVDRVVPPDQARRLAAALAAADRPHELVIYEDVSHYLDPDNPTDETRRVYAVVVRFLREVMEG